MMKGSRKFEDNFGFEELVVIGVRVFFLFWVSRFCVLMFFFVCWGDIFLW